MKSLTLGFGYNVDVKEIQGYIVDYWKQLDEVTRLFLLDEVLYVQNTDGLKVLVEHMMESQQVIDGLAEENSTLRQQLQEQMKEHGK